ncbi:MAG: DUF3782 domain-containing protein, partial [Chthoniobacterales bacterium]|nr:DUF3782 domain-containing protein [Chthoniobacterales bacterium]
QETDKKFQATDKKFESTDKKIEKLADQVERTEQQVEKAEKQIERSGKLIEELKQTVENLSRRFGDLGNRLGEFVEEMIKPSLVRLFRERELEVHEVCERVRALRGGESVEVDMLVINERQAVAVECKSRVTVEEVRRHVERLARVRRLVSLVSGRELYGAVAGMVVEEEAQRVAEEEAQRVAEEEAQRVAEEEGLYV